MKIVLCIKIINLILIKPSIIVSNPQQSWLIHFYTTSNKSNSHIEYPHFSIASSIPIICFEQENIHIPKKHFLSHAWFTYMIAQYIRLLKGKNEMRHSKRHCIKYLMGYNSLTDVSTTTTLVRTSEPLKKIPNKIPTFQRVNCKIILDY